MILVTTTPSVDGYTITNYQGIVFGEVVSGVNMFKDLGAGLRNMFGGRSQGYEEELMRARNEAIAEMQQRAEAMGAHAVVGVDIDYEVLGADNGMLDGHRVRTAVQIGAYGLSPSSTAWARTRPSSRALSVIVTHCTDAHDHTNRSIRPAARRGPRHTRAGVHPRTRLAAGVR